jgi:hypothetical protein
MNRLICIFTAGLLVVLGAISSQTAVAEENCKKVSAHGTLIGYEFDCELNGEKYLYCPQMTLKGQSKGRWDAGVKEEWDFLSMNGAVLQSGAVLPTPDDTYNFWGREFDVLKLKHGNIFAEAQYYIDARIYDVNSAFPWSMLITGGTGIYEGATGWILAVFEDSSFEKARLQGQVCGPYIPGRNDGDDSDD